MVVPSRVKNVRQELLNSWGLPVVENYVAPKATATKSKAGLFKAKEKVKSKHKVTLQLLLVNGRPTLLLKESGTTPATRILQNHGFSRAKQFYYTTAKPKRLIRGLDKLLLSGFEVARQGVTEMKRTRTAITKSTKDLKFNARLARGLELVNPFERTTPNDRNVKVIRPLTMLVNNRVMLTLPETLNAKQVTDVKLKGIKWHKSADYLVWSAKSMRDARAQLKKLVAIEDLELNKEELAKQFNSILKG